MEELKTIYICRICNSMFFSHYEIVEHKAMTGHREYAKAEQLTEERK